MRKISITVEEVCKYNREIIIEIPDDMDEREIEKMLNKAQKESQSTEDACHVLANYNKKIVVTEIPDTDLDSPDDFEIETLEYEFVD